MAGAWAEVRARLKTPRAMQPFADWLRTVTPAYTWTWPHIRYIRAHLDRITDGTLKRLIIECPPRHGKSELATIRYPVYRLEREPTLRVMIGAYNQTLADKFSRAARRIASARMPLNRERTAVEDWQTEQGGGLRAVGVGGGATGQGADLVVLDDPIKSRKEAESLAYRDGVWDWYTNDIYTRLEPGGAIVIIMTRWHKDDLVGRILDSEDGANWTVISLPAEALPGDPLGRGEGEALCPDRYPLSALAEIHKVLGRDYSALYQQQPQPREGGMFKEHWLPLASAVPARARRVRWWDKAATADGGDWTVGVLLAMLDGVIYVEDVVRGQWSSGERDRIIRSTALKDATLHPSGPVVVWTEQEPGSSGKDAALSFVRLLTGFEVHTEPATGSKEVRAGPLASQAEAGNLRVLRAPWTAGFIAELCDFPSGAHDDQCLVAGTIIETVLGNMPIEKVQVGDYVLTRQGYRRVLASGMTNHAADVVTAYLSDGNSITGTRNHPIFTLEKGFIPLDASSGYGIMTACQNQKRSPIRELLFDAIRSRKARHIETIFGPIRRIFAQGLDIYTKRFGKTHMAQFRKAIKSTTKMATHSTMSFTTWNASPMLSTSAGIPKWEHGQAAMRSKLTWIEFALLPKNGTPHQMVAHGTRIMAKRHGLAENQSFMSALFAAKNLSPLHLGINMVLSFVPGYAPNANALHLVDGSSKSNAPFAEKHLKDSQGKQIARVSVVRVQDGVGKRAVYNLAVDGASEYFANGVLVHNCDAASGAYNKLAFGQEPAIIMVTNYAR